MLAHLLMCRPVCFLAFGTAILNTYQQVTEFYQMIAHTWTMRQLLQTLVASFLQFRGAQFDVLLLAHSTRPSIMVCIVRGVATI